MKQNPLNDIIARTCWDKSFREELLRDPANILRSAGIQVPDGTNIRVMENTDEEIYVVLPTSGDDQPTEWAYDDRPEPGQETRSGDLVMKWSSFGLDLSGRITSDSIQMLRQELDKVSGNLVVDFREVTFMGSAGIGVFLTVQKRLAANGKQLCLCDVSPSIRNIFSLSGMDSFFKFGSGDLKNTWWMCFPVM
jgi:anti-anti-sigma factor